MKALFSVLILALIAYGAWAYYELYRFEHALIDGDEGVLRELTDMEAVRQELKAQFDRNLGSSDNPVLKWFQGNMQRLNAETMDRLVNMEWIREKLMAKVNEDRGAIVPGIGFAFFESPTRLLVRYGELGREPVHLYMSLQLDVRRWQVTAIYP